MAHGHRGVKPLLVNRYEKVTHQLLTTAAADNGDELWAKVRLADVIDEAGYTGRLKQYALSAHLDFVMVDPATSLPRFAVEFDGKQHFTDHATRERDRLKDTLCLKAELPLLRITSEYTRTQGRWTILSYVVEGFYHSLAFFEAQERGYIPLDEPYDFGNVIATDEDGRLLFNTLDAATRLHLLELHKANHLPSFCPDVYLTTNATEGSVDAHAFMAVARDRYLIGRTRLRDCRFQGVSPHEIAEQLAVVEVDALADQWLAGQPAACNGATLAKSMEKVQQAIDTGGLLSVTGGGALRAGGPLPVTITIQHP